MKIALSKYVFFSSYANLPLSAIKFIMSEENNALHRINELNRNEIKKELKFLSKQPKIIFRNIEEKAIKIEKELQENPIEIIEEYIGNVNSETPELSVAKMKSPGGWEEPGQRPEFDEFTVVLKGTLRVKTETEILYINAGVAVVTKANEWIQYSTPNADGAEYIAVCLPAFSPKTVHRDND